MLFYILIYKESIACHNIILIFILFSATSCSISKIPEDSYVSYNTNSLTIKCNYSDVTWKVNCRDIASWLATEHKCPLGEPH